MKIGNKEFSDYWKIIKIPTIILIAWSVLGFIIASISFSLYLSIFTATSGWFLMLGVFSFIGWHAVKDFKETTKIAAYSGAIAGAISGIIGAVIGILMVYIVPNFVDFLASQSTSSGVDAAAVQGFIKIGMYIGLVTGPIISAIIGAIIATLVALVAKKI